MIDLIPYRADKNLGKAYNDAFKSLPNESALCVRDYDTLWLLHDYNVQLDGYHKRYPNSVLTCYTNRISSLSTAQLYTGNVSENTDFKTQIQIAERIRVTAGRNYSVTKIDQDISGMMLVIPRSVWLQHPFNEDKLCLGVDTEWNRRIRAAGVTILRMDGVYIWHSYRLINGVSNKTHLK